MINNIFYVSLLEQNITKKGQVTNIEKKLEFDIRSYKKYKMEAIQDIMIFAIVSKLEQPPELYYLVS